MKKCFQIKFIRNKQNLKSQYCLNNKKKKHVITSKVKYLGIIFSSDLTFTKYNINVICNKGLQAFRFLSSNC